MKKGKKANEALIVKYNNDLNLLTFPKLSLTQKKMVQLILAITRDEKESKEHQNFLAKFFNKDTRTIEIEFAKFYKLVNGNEWKIGAFEVGAMVDDMLDKLLHAVLSYEDEYKILKFVCFEKAAYIKYEGVVRITIQKDFYEMITAYESGFTIIDYFEYCSLNSVYSQNLYPILRQFRNTGAITIFRDKWAQFCSIMQFPENAAMRDIDKILRQIIKELTKPRNLFDTERIPFKNLRYKKLKSGGNKITGIEFYFTPESTEPNIESNPYQKYIGRIFINRFIKPNPKAYIIKEIKCEKDPINQQDTIYMKLQDTNGNMGKASLPACDFDDKIVKNLSVL